MPIVQHSKPVVVRHPVTDQWIAVHQGKVLEDDDPIATSPLFSWLFEADDAEPAQRESVPLAEVLADVPVKRAAKKA